MADTKISALTAATAAALANEFAINEAGTSKKLTLQQVLDGADVLANAAALADANKLMVIQSSVAKDSPLTDLVTYLQTKGMPKVSRLNTQHDNATTTPTEIANGLEMTGLVAGTYKFQYNIIHQAGLTTTGVRFNANFSGTVSSFVYWRRFYGLIATAADANQDQTSVLAAGQVMQGWADKTKQTTEVTGVTLSTDTAASDMLTIVEGIFVATGTGDLELWHGSEVAATTSVMVGTSLTVIRTA